MSARIDKNEMFDMLLEACPNIEKDWKEHLEYWGEEKPGDYTNIAEFAHYVVDEHQKIADFLSNFFSLVEKPPAGFYQTSQVNLGRMAGRINLVHYLRRY